MGEQEELRWDPRCFFDIVRSRRTVRRFKPDGVPDEDVRQILDAARLAPTAGNQQPWRFLVVRDRAKLDELRDDALALVLEELREQLYELPPDEIQAHRDRITDYLDGYLSAPVYILVLLDQESPYPQYNVQDGTLAAAHLMLAARALGYGTAYGTDAVAPVAVRRVFAIPQRYELLCLLPVGVPEAWPETPPKKSLDEVIAYEQPTFVNPA